MLIVHSAKFSPSNNKLNCSSITRHSQATSEVVESRRSRNVLREDIRRFVNRRCSGYSSGEECKFSLLLDVVESEVWGGGLVTITHSCLHTRDIRADCGEEPQELSLVNTTVLMSPSYPKYYLSVSGGCGWRVRLPPHQSLLVRVLDLQLRAARDDLAGHCQDSLLIDNRVNICGELHSELHYVSKANSVLIQFRIGPDRQASLTSVIIIIIISCLSRLLKAENADSAQ